MVWRFFVTVWVFCSSKWSMFCSQSPGRVLQVYLFRDGPEWQPPIPPHAPIRHLLTQTYLAQRLLPTAPASSFRSFLLRLASIARHLHLVRRWHLSPPSQLLAGHGAAPEVCHLPADQPGRRGRIWTLRLQHTIEEDLIRGVAHAESFRQLRHPSHARRQLHLPGPPHDVDVDGCWRLGGRGRCRPSSQTAQAFTQLHLRAPAAPHWALAYGHLLRASLGLGDGRKLLRADERREQSSTQQHDRHDGLFTAPQRFVLKVLQKVFTALLHI